MDYILNRICSISRHPISRLDTKFRMKYVLGLGACLYRLSHNSSTTYLFFTSWAKSIMGKELDFQTIWKEDDKAIRKALSIHRSGIRFFTMRYSFLFDVFYLLSSGVSNNTTDFLADKYKFLSEKICGLLANKTLDNLLTKKILEKVYRFFVYGEPCVKIEQALIEHKLLNEKHLKQPEKRVLVVANVSAGKSTLINALVGYRLSRSMTTACTNKLVFLHNKPIHDGITIKNENGCYFYFDQLESVNSDQFTSAAFPFNSILSQNRICLIDAPGINNSENQQHRKITEEALSRHNYDVVIYVSNCQYFGTNDESETLHLLKQHVKSPILFVLNQLDRFKQKEDSIVRMLNHYHHYLVNIGFKNPQLFPVSAQASLLAKLPNEMLDEDDLAEKEFFIKKFQIKLFNLSSYVRTENTTDILCKTGIKHLELSILQALQIKHEED